MTSSNDNAGALVLLAALVTGGAIAGVVILHSRRRSKGEARRQAREAAEGRQLRADRRAVERSDRVAARLLGYDPDAVAAFDAEMRVLGIAGPKPMSVRRAEPPIGIDPLAYLGQLQQAETGRGPLALTKRRRIP